MGEVENWNGTADINPPIVCFACISSSYTDNSQNENKPAHNKSLENFMMLQNATSTNEVEPVPMVIGTLLLSLIGVFGNGMIILATVTSPMLRARCNILICILAISDFFVCTYLVQLRILMLMKWYFRPNIECYIYSIVGLFSLNIQAGMGLILGIDRLLAVSLATKYQRVPKVLYVVMVAFVFAGAASIVLYGFLDSTDEPVPVCFPPTAYNKKSRQFWIGYNFVISLMVITVYGAAHVICRRLRATAINVQSTERIRRLLNSLSIIICFYTSSWFLTLIVLIIIQLSPPSPTTIMLINQQLGWFVIINASLNFFVYFWRASEYRKVFFRLLRLKRERNSTSNTKSSRSVHATVQTVQNS